MAAQQLQLGGFSLNLDPNYWKAQADGWLKKQHPAVEVLVTGLASGAQGGALGYMLGSFSNMDPTAGAPGMNDSLKALQGGGPWQQARNLSVMTGMNAALSLAIKRARNGKEDVWGSMGAAFGAGIAFTLVSGVADPMQSAFTTGAAFAAFNGLFYQLGKSFGQGTPENESEFEQGKYILRMLGLQKFEKNLQKGQLTDNTIMLWNDRALQEAKFPPGPRLLILHHVNQFRQPSDVLKPALPPPMTSMRQMQMQKRG